MKTKEDWIKEFEERIASARYEKDKYHDIKEGTDTLLARENYIENPYKIDGDKVKDFISQLYDSAFELGCDVPSMADSKMKNEWVELGYKRARDETRIGFLRQWLNEDRIIDESKMVTNEQIEKMLYGQ